MSKKSFTLLEIVIVVVVIGVLATLGMPAYQTFIEDSKAKVCQTNLKALDTALNIYAMEHDAMPGDLSQIPPECIEKAYAQILRKEGSWKIKLAYYVVGWEQRGLAYAGLLNAIAKGNIQLISCPADLTSPAVVSGGISYGMNADLKNMTAQDFNDLPDETLLIGDCEKKEFQDATKLEDNRHKHPRVLANAQTYAQAIEKSGDTVEVKGGKKERHPKSKKHPSPAQVH